MINFKPILSAIDDIIRFVCILISILVVAALIVDYGFELDVYEMAFVHTIYRVGWWVYSLSFIYRLIVHWREVLRKGISLTLILGLLLCVSALPMFVDAPASSAILTNLWIFLNHKFFILTIIGLLALIELSRWVVNFANKKTNPALLIVICFMGIIAFGALLLMLPRSTMEHIRLPIVDALFVSTSAVCVTGLTPVEVAHTFTLEGQIIIALLIQIGGLGIMTITSFFAFFFMDGIGLYSQFSLKNMISSSVDSLKSTLLNVIGFTIVIEAIGAFFIWLSVHSTMGMTLDEEIFFSIFHSVSAFCNAGFSTIEGNLGNELVLQGHNAFFTTISLLIVLGGLGFPILVSLKRVLAYHCSMLFHKLFRKDRRGPRYMHITDVNTKIVLYATSALVLLGAVWIAIFEWNGAFAGFTTGEKIVQSFFNSIVPRTAGFNSVAASEFSRITIILFMLLMWIGGGAQSTAGGIKVNTLVVSLASFKSLVRGEQTTTLFNREITYNSIRRTMVMVFGSMCIILFFFVGLMLMEPNLPTMDLLFETISAFSTVGSSLGITPLLSDASKVWLVALMFLGRVGFVTVFMSFLSQKEQPKYRLPKEEIIIN